PCAPGAVLRPPATASRCAPSRCNPSISSFKETELMEHAIAEGLGFAHFLTQADGVGKTVLGVLLLLSVASWYLIVTRALANTLAQRRAETFLKRFWHAGSLDEGRVALSPQAADNAFARLVQRAAEAAGEVERQGSKNLAVAGG